MKNELSGIWKQVIQNPLVPDLSSSGYNSVIDAAKFVIDTQDPVFFFRRNRELIDLSHRFRFFRFQGSDYIIKLAGSNEVPIEYLNALRLNNILQELSLEHIHVVVPRIIRSDANGTIGMIQKDHGYTIYENIKESRNRINLQEVMKLYGNLMNHGIEWSGWLPRNLFLEGSELWLIDLEDVYFHEVADFSIRDLTLFKLILGWGQIFDKEQVSIELAMIVGNRKIATTYPDSFEKALSELLNSRDLPKVRQIGFEITYESELPLINQTINNVYLNCMDVGHLMEDIFDNNYLSVWYTISTAKLRRIYGERIYADFLVSFEHVLLTWLRISDKVTYNSDTIQSLRQLSVCLMICFFSQPHGNIYEKLKSAVSTDEIFRQLECVNPCVASIMNFQRLKYTKGWDAAISRSKYMHSFLSYMFKLLTWSFSCFFEYNLLIRGSCAQGLMSIHSDIDFEISNEKYPMGFIPAEKLLSGILTVFDLANEGSIARPTETDMVSQTGYTRDFHEWCELTVPDCIVPDKGWLNGLFCVDSVWQYYSEYESHKHNLSSKYLFFKVRSIVERYSLKYNINKVFIDEKICELNKKNIFDDPDLLFKITSRCLDYYESTTIDFDEILELNQCIDMLYAHVGVRYHD